MIARAGSRCFRQSRQHAPLLEDYCRLPVTSIYRVKADRSDLIPLTYNEPGELDASIREKIERRGGAWLIIRGRPATARLIAEQLIAYRRSDSATRANPWRLFNAHSFGQVQVLTLTP